MHFHNKLNQHIYQVSEIFRTHSTGTACYPSLHLQQFEAVGEVFNLEKHLRNVLLTICFKVTCLTILYINLSKVNST